jgi:hypothetical protein
MVYGIGQGRPTHKHDSEHSAQQEATRLARSMPGVQFVVLEAKTGYMVPPRPIDVEVLSYVDLPF